MLNDAGKEWFYEGGSNRDVKPGSLGSSPIKKNIATNQRMVTSMSGNNKNARELVSVLNIANKVDISIL
jgi:hypothetical protein